MADQPTLSSVRLDVWLDVACLFKTRSEAQKGCDGGKVEVNDQRAKSHRLLHLGDRLRITRGAGRRQLIVVKAFADRHLPKGEARLLYEDVTPPPTPEEVAARELERFFWKDRSAVSRAAPNRRERQERRRAKEQGL